MSRYRTLIVAILRDRDHLKSFELGRISDVAMSDADLKELSQAEELAKLFLKWKPLEDGGAEDDGPYEAKTVLCQMIDSIGTVE